MLIVLKRCSPIILKSFIDTFGTENQHFAGHHINHVWPNIDRMTVYLNIRVCWLGLRAAVTLPYPNLNYLQILYPIFYNKNVLLKTLDPFHSENGWRMIE